MRKRQILENFQNVGWALVFAVAIWLVMVQSQQRSEQLKASLTVFAPGFVNVQYAHPEQREVRVTVRGAASDLERMLNRSTNRVLEGSYQIPDKSSMGTKKIPVRDFTFTLDPGVEIDRTELTQEVDVTLDQEKRARLPLELDLDATPPDGWELVNTPEDRPRLEPTELDASGPIAKMNQEPAIRTVPLSLTKILAKRGFDEKSRDPQPFEQLVSVSAPAEIQVAQAPVKFIFSIRPKPREADIELTPAIQFQGPVFPGLPWKLVPLPGEEKIKLRVSGAELDLLEKTIEKTKERFICFARPRPDFAEKGSLTPGGFVNFDVVVIPPKGIQLLSEPNPKLVHFTVKAPDAEDK